MAITINASNVKATETKRHRGGNRLLESNIAKALASIEVGKETVFGIEYDDASTEKLERLEAALDRTGDDALPERDAINVHLAIQAVENAVIDGEVTKMRSLTFHVMDRHPETFQVSRLSMSVDRGARTITISHKAEARKAQVKVTTKSVDVDAVLDAMYHLCGAIPKA